MAVGLLLPPIRTTIDFGAFVTFWVEMSKPLWYDGIPINFEFRDDEDVEGQGMPMTENQIKKLLAKTLLRNGAMPYSLYEYELEEKLEELKSSLEEDQDDHPQITPLVGDIVFPLGAYVLVPVVPFEVVNVPVRRTSRQSKSPRRDLIEGYIVHKSHEVLILDKEKPTTLRATMESSDSELVWSNEI